MSEDLANEIEAIRSIFGHDVLREADIALVYILSIPNREASVRVLFPSDYPESVPRLLGTERTGAQARKGYGSHVLDIARATLLSVFIPGSVCLFDLLQELEIALAEESIGQQSLPPDPKEDGSLVPSAVPSDTCGLGEDPHWFISSPITEKKSTFMARACTVTSPAQAQACVARLLEDKRAAKATHTISAYRIRALPIADSTHEIMYQDCDDDGENAAGGRLLHLLQVMNALNVLVIVSRWFVLPQPIVSLLRQIGSLGILSRDSRASPDMIMLKWRTQPRYGGVKLGPDRFNIINNVAREAVVQGGWTNGRTKND